MSLAGRVCSHSGHPPLPCLRSSVPARRLRGESPEDITGAEARPLGFFKAPPGECDRQALAYRTRILLESQIGCCLLPWTHPAPAGTGCSHAKACGYLLLTAHGILEKDPSTGTLSVDTAREKHLVGGTLGVFSGQCVGVFSPRLLC